MRAIILKARQLGVSTYIAARFCRATTASPGLKTIIIGHERRASSNLFQIVKCARWFYRRSAAIGRNARWH